LGGNHEEVCLLIHRFVNRYRFCSSPRVRQIINARHDEGRGSRHGNDGDDEDDGAVQFDDETGHQSQETALDILKKRYARGEISDTEFENMKKQIQ
jgi:Short C-terminal domain